MSNYLRAIEPGGCFFFTVVTYNRQPHFSNIQNVNRLRDGFRKVIDKHPFTIDAIVIMPDHIHTIWQLPEDDTNYSLRWRLIKHYVATGIGDQSTRRGEKRI
ncbi:transposase [Pseudomonadota bacterium]